MIEKLSNLFRFYREAVLGIRDYEIVFFNPAAQELFGEMHIRCRADLFFSSEILDRCGTGFAASESVKGRPLKISGSNIDDISVFILSPDRGINEDYAGMLASVNFQMRESLAVLSVSLDLLSSAIERLERPDMEGHMSITLHNYYKLSRIAQNLTLYTDLATGIISDTESASSPAPATPSASSASYASSASFAPKNTDVVALLSELTSTVSGLIKAQSITLSFECKEVSHITAVDRGTFSLMILNLLSNSLKNTGPGGLIVVSLKSSKGKIIISVSDTGKGIPPERLYSSLGKLDEELRPSDISSGLGLGIPVVSRIASLHGGSLLMESREGRGTSVNITIPDKVVDSNLLRENILDTGNVGMQNIYTQLADVLPSEAYSFKYLD